MTKDLPSVLTYDKKICTRIEENDKKLKDLAVISGICSNKTPEDIASKMFIQSIRDLNSKMGIGQKIKDIKEKDIKKLAKYASKEANPIYPVPVLMNKKELQKLYYSLI